MNTLQKRVSKLERPIGTGEPFDFTVHMIEAGTMRVTSRLRLITGGAVEVDEDGNAMKTCIVEREAAK